MEITSVHTFPDDSLLAAREHATRVMGQPKKLPVPVILPDSAPDRYGVTFPSVIYDEEEQIFKAWYTALTRSSERHLADPLEDRHAPDLLCYATSRDGIEWEKPELGLYEIGGSKANNVCDLVHGENVVKDKHDADPQRRYKRFMYDSSNRALHILFSPDGVHWTWPTRKRPLFSGWDVVHDTNFLMGWDDRCGKYVAFLRPPVSLDPGRRRKIGVSMTDDPLQWPAPEIVLEADDSDPSDDGTASSPAGMDLYQMTGFPYGQGYLGLLNCFDAQLSREFNDPIYVSLASSPDCRTWQRSLRSRLLSTGNPGDFDGGMVYASCQPVAYRDELYFYYGAYPQYHAGWCPAHAATDPDRMPSVGLAKLRLDGFVGLYTNPYPGRIVTAPIVVDGDRMLINSVPDLRNDGWLRVEIQESSGSPIEGYSRDECRPITEDGPYNEVTWSSGKTIADLKGRAVRICIHQWENVFYGFRFACAPG